MYAIELVGDGETKISCPLLSPVKPEPTKSPTNVPETETESQSKGVPQSSSPTSAPEPTPASPVQTAVPHEKPNQGPKDIYQPQVPHFPFHSNYFYPFYPAKPAPTVQPTSPSVIDETDGPQQTVPSEKLPFNPEGQVPQQFINFPFYPWPLPPEPPVESEQPNGQEKQPFNPYPFFVKPQNPDSVPPAPSLAPSVVETTKAERLHPFYPNPLYPQPSVPENPPIKLPVTEPSRILEEKRHPNPVNHPYSFLPQGPYQMPVPPTHQTATPLFQGQVQPLSPMQPGVFQPEALENLSPSKPPAPEIQEPSKPEAPKRQMYNPFYHYPFNSTTLYPQPESEKQPATMPPQPPQPETPQGQVYNPFYQNPFYPNPFYLHPEPENQPATKPAQPEAPQGQVHQPLYPQPVPENQLTIKPPQPPQPEAPQGQVNNPFYPYPFYSQPKHENQPATKPTAVPQPEQPEASQGQDYQPVYPQPKPENQPEAPQGQVHHPFYPYPYYPNPFYPQPEPEKQTAILNPPENETSQSEADKPSHPHTEKPPEGQVPHHFSPLYYPQLPQQPLPVTLPPASSMQQGTTPASGENLTESAIPKPSNGGIVPQGSQLGYSYLPPVHCPQYCPPGVSNCCPQIAFHQHLHHFFPAGFGNKDAPPVYPGLPFLPSVAYSGFGKGFSSTPSPQKPTKATTTPTSDSTPQSPSSGSEKQPYLQPPDGNPAALPENPSKPTNPQHQLYPYFVPNSLYSNWPYQPQNDEQQTLPQRQSPAYYIVPSQTQASGNEPVSSLERYEPYNLQLPKQQRKLSGGDMSNLSRPNFISLISQNLQQQQHTAKQQNKPQAKEWQPNAESSQPDGPSPEVQSEINHPLVPYYMPQDAQAPPFNKLVIPDNSTRQPLVNNLKKPVRHEQTVSASSKPKSYVLLQHGPPGREPSGFESPQPYRQEKPQRSKWLGIGMANLLRANSNHMPAGDISENAPLHFSLGDSDTLPLHQDPSFSGAHLKPKPFNSKDFWKSMIPLGPIQKFPLHVPGKEYQRWSAAADHGAYGMLFLFCYILSKSTTVC